MKLGVMVPQIGFRAKPAAIRDVAQAAETLGMSSLWVTDHFVVPEQLESGYPYSSTQSIPMDGRQPMLELFTTLAYLASITSSVTLGSGVCVMPYRPAVLLAKQVATVDQLSEGRLVLGVGTGWMREEFEALEMEFQGRGQHTDELLSFLHTALTTPGPIDLPPSSGVEHRYFLRPGTFEDRRLPVWVGGSGERAMRRSVEHGDVWFPHVFGTDPDSVVAGRARLAALSSDVGAATPGVAMVAPLNLVETSNGTGSAPWAHSAPSSTPDEFARVVARYEAAGVEHMMLMIAGSPETRISAMEAIARVLQIGAPA